MTVLELAPEGSKLGEAEALSRPATCDKRKAPEAFLHHLVKCCAEAPGHVLHFFEKHAK